MIDQIWLFYMTLRDLAQGLHGFMSAAGLLFLVLVAIFWNAVAAHFVDRGNLKSARKASAAVCLIYSLLRTQTILQNGTNALLETAIHIYLMYHIGYPLFLFIIIPVRRFPSMIGSTWMYRLKPILGKVLGFVGLLRLAAQSCFTNKRRAEQEAADRKLAERTARKQKKLKEASDQICYELDLHYRLLPKEDRGTLHPETYASLRQSVVDTEDVHVMQLRATKLHELIDTLLSKHSTRTPSIPTSRIDEIGAEFAQQREHIHGSPVYDQHQKDQLVSFLNRLEGVELENYLKEKIRGIPD